MGSLAWRSACKAGPSRVLRKAAGRPPRIFLQQLSCHKVMSRQCISKGRCQRTLCMLPGALTPSHSCLHNLVLACVGLRRALRSGTVCEEPCTADLQRISQSILDSLCHLPVLSAIVLEQVPPSCSLHHLTARCSSSASQKFPIQQRNAMPI